ncbi:hypothetical protein M8R20_18535 [Pseudomonas sp. R2.Fl]|nr:hypothetical protein [Pseudomonas sp. R2.Fl]
MSHPRQSPPPAATGRPHLKVVWSNDHPQSWLSLVETTRKPTDIAPGNPAFGFALAAATLHVTPELLQAQWEMLEASQSAHEPKESLWSRIRRWFRPAGT